MQGSLVERVSLLFKWIAQSLKYKNLLFATDFRELRPYHITLQTRPLGIRLIGQ